MESELLNFTMAQEFWGRTVQTPLGFIIENYSTYIFMKTKRTSTFDRSIEELLNFTVGTNRTIIIVLYFKLDH